MFDRRVKIYFDGGCRPNPGTMSAAVVVRGVTHHFADLGQGSSTQAEWLALIEALRLALSLGLQNFVLIGDAAGVINHANARWLCRSADLRVVFDRFVALRGDRVIAIKKVGRSQNLAGIALAKVRF